MLRRIDPLGSGWIRRTILPAVWLLSAVVISVFGGLKPPIIAMEGGPPRSSILADDESYYFLAHIHYLTSFAVVLAVFAVIYFLLDAVFRARYWRPLGWVHFGLMAAGSFLVDAPSLLLRTNALPIQSTDPERAFTIWNDVSLVGYGLTLVSLVLFLALLGNVLIGHFKPRVRDAQRP